MRILVIDGQGGGLGARLTAGLRAALPPDTALLVVGTNALATSAMLKAGADLGATGENAVIWNACRADLITGPIGIVLANAMLGEITPAMACAVASSDAEKVLIPAARCTVRVVGVRSLPMADQITEAVSLILSQISARPK